MEASSQVGYGFRPTDGELINYYLRLKNKGKESKVKAIAEVDLCKFEPWELPGLSKIQNYDPEWFFFCSRNQKYPKGRRFDRATKAGYWKATGKDRPIKSRSSGMKIGMKKTLVFYKGRAPNGERTAWVIHEYHTNSEKCAYVLCRLFNKYPEVDDSNYDEIEVSEFTPTAPGSSPEDIPSNQQMDHSTSESNIQVVEQLTGIEKYPNTYVPSNVEDRLRATEEEWSSFFNELTNELVKNSNCDEISLSGSIPTAATSLIGIPPNQLTVQSNSESDALVPKEHFCNTVMASDVEDHLAEVRATEMDPLSLSFFNDPKIFSPLRLEMFPGLESSYMDSSFAGYFAKEHNRMLFQGDDDEVGFTYPILRPELAVHNNQEYSCVESTNQENSTFYDAQSFLPDQNHDMDTMVASGSCMHTSVAQGPSGGWYGDLDCHSNTGLVEQLSYLERMTSRSRRNEEDNEAKPTVAAATGDAKPRIMMAQNTFIGEFDKSLGLRSRSRQIINNEPRPTVSQAVGKAAKHTETSGISDPLAENLNSMIVSLQSDERLTLSSNIQGSSLLAARHSNFSYRVMVVVILIMVLFVLIFGAWKWLKF